MSGYVTAPYVPIVVAGQRMFPLKQLELFSDNEGASSLAMMQYERGFSDGKNGFPPSLLRGAYIAGYSNGLGERKSYDDW